MISRIAYVSWSDALKDIKDTRGRMRVLWWCTSRMCSRPCQPIHTFSSVLASLPFERARTHAHTRARTHTKRTRTHITHTHTHTHTRTRTHTHNTHTKIPALQVDDDNPSALMLHRLESAFKHPCVVIRKILPIQTGLVFHFRRVELSAVELYACMRVTTRVLHTYSTCVLIHGPRQRLAIMPSG